MTRETAVLTFRTSHDGRHNVRFNAPRATLTRANLDMPISMLTSGIQYFDDEIGLLEDFIEAHRITVTSEKII